LGLGMCEQRHPCRSSTGLLRLGDGRLVYPPGKNGYSKTRLDSAVSWGALLGRLARLARLKVFDRSNESAPPLTY
jgi:hypothetical protein